MYFSKYSIILPFPGDKYSYALINALSGAFDLATEDEINQIKLIEQGTPYHTEMAQYLLERGYAFHNPEEEKKLLEQKKAEFLAEIESDPTQLLFALTYNCNLACAYCFQKDMTTDGKLVTQETIDKFFESVKELLPYELTPPFVTLFGGEPLINSPQQRKIVEYMVEKANHAGYGIAVVTNGYHLEEYIDILGEAYIREIQVTIDGTAQHHDKRRIKADGKGTFEKIMSGVAKALEKKLPINFRVVLDKENLPSLVELAEEINAKGWLDLPETLFKTQIGRNYELFDCYMTPQHLFSQAELWEAFTEIAAKNPILKKFHRPDLKGLKYLVQTGDLPMPSYDTCPGCKKEWAFDLYGNIYPCTANVGREEYKIGTFLPALQLDAAKIKEWQERNITRIPECKSCDIALQCGGGCGVVAKKINGSILSPDCRDIKELYKTGFSFYKDEIIKLSEKGDDNE